MENSKVYQSHIITTWIIITLMNKKFTGFCLLVHDFRFLFKSSNKLKNITHLEKEPDKGLVIHTKSIFQSEFQIL